jgi:hypothetical protein
VRTYSLDTVESSFLGTNRSNHESELSVGALTATGRIAKSDEVGYRLVSV